MQSIHTVITRRFLKQALLPVLVIEISLVIALFLLNNYQSEQNHQALATISAESFNEFAQQSAEIISKRMMYDQSKLLQIKKTADILLQHKENLTVEPQDWRFRSGFFQLVTPHDTNDTTLRPTPVYTTNLQALTPSDYRHLTLLRTLMPSIKSSVDTESDLISSAWVNIDNRYAAAYPPIIPEESLSPNLDVTQYPFYYLADPLNNPSRSAVFVPLYKEVWAIENGELGAYLMPLYEQDKFIGVIGLTLTGKTFDEFFSTMQLPFDAYAMLIDDENHMIITTDDQSVLQTFGERSFSALYKDSSLKEKTLKQIDFSRLDTDTHIVHRHHIDAHGLNFIIVAQKEKVFATVDMVTSHAQIIGYTFIVAIALFYFAFFLWTSRSLKTLAASITTPIQRMADFSSKLGRVEGITLESTPVKELDELGSNLTQTHNKLINMVTRDESTGLYNRHKLLLDLQDETVKSLMLIQLGDYKTLHNLYGQGIVDTIISGIVAEIRSHASFQVYRAGEDDFALTSTGDDYENFHLAYQAIASLSISFESITLHPSVFAGMSQRRDNGDELIEQAGIALLYAQRNIATKPICYQEAKSMKQAFDENLDWTNRLNMALQHDKLVPYFQPLLNLHTKKIEKFESLVRMIDGDNIISPTHFLPAAAAAGKGHEITRVMINKVMHTASSYPDIGFTINISFRDFGEFDLHGYAIERCRFYGVDPRQITFELLETDALTQPEKTLKKITALKHEGFRIAIDDFGTGHSNFAHLMQMRVDYIKIDGQFVKSILKDPNSATITKTIAQFANVVGAQSVAEYVCEESIMRRLRQFHVDYAQGYAISPPLPSEQIGAVLHKTFRLL